jgi:transcriptional regulator with AAA-type ATPase domain
MKPPPPRSLLVEHPALPRPFEAADSIRSLVSLKSLDHLDRYRAAVQLAALSALLAEFELWPGQWALRRAVAEITDDGPRVILPSLPVPLSRIWSRLGGGDLAAERTRTAVLKTIAEATGVDLEGRGRGAFETGFFLDGALAGWLEKLDLPLDSATARSLWMLRWSLPPCPEIGDVRLLAVPDPAVAERIGMAMWAAAIRRGASASFEVVGASEAANQRLGDSQNGGVRILVGELNERILTSLTDRNGNIEGCAVALGRFPEGWNPTPAPVFDLDHLPVHLSIAGLSPARKLSWIEERNGRFNPFSRADRRLLTSSAAHLFSGPRRRTRRRFRELVQVAALVPDGVPVQHALELAGISETDLDAARQDHAVVLRRGRIAVPESTPLNIDPRHAEVMGLFDEGDPRRLLHRALADGNTGELLSWARARLDDLDAVAVRGLLGGLEAGALGPGVQAVLVEACLCLADIHGARRALTGLNDEIARPWSNWLRLMDRPPELEVEFPRPLDIRHAPRASAEIALVSVRRALWWKSESAEEPLQLVRAALSGLNGMARRWVEIKLTALVDPDRLADAGWRREATGGHPELIGLVLFERSLRATFETQVKFANRLLRRVMSAERAPGRLAFMQVNLGTLEADAGHHQVAEALTLGAFRLFQAAGFRHRLWDALHNLAVMDIDQLRVDRARARLDAVAEAQHTLFVEIERTRLALAVGDLELFRSRLAGLPLVDDLSNPQIVQALSFLNGVEALFFSSADVVAPLLRAGGQEGLVWLELADAIDRRDDRPEGSHTDGWGVRRAAFLVRAGREIRSIRKLDKLIGGPLDLREALAVTLVAEFGCRSGWPGPDLRGRAAVILAERGMSGWAARVRWGSSEVENLLQGFVGLVRSHDSGAEIDGVLEDVLSRLGMTGLVVQMVDRDREVLRLGTGLAGCGELRGALEVIPLGSEPIRGSAWTLLCDLLELMIPVAGKEELRSDRSEVRIDGSSPAVERLRHEVQLHAGPGYAVLVHGETGSGKEIVARELHRLSGRTGGMVSVNIAAIPINLIEAELFGSVKGAFTGAERSRGGLVSAADGGTLFLDEVGDLDLALQVKLLRFLESGEVRPVGSDRTSLMDVRVVCATHRNLDRLVRDGRFRGDLFFRMAVARIRVPPLRERVEDILILRSIFEREASRQHGLQVSKWSSAAERWLLNHRWPGNVRELMHTIEVAMARAAGGNIRPEHLPLTEQPTALRGTWESTVGDFKRRFLCDVLSRHRGNRSAAARELGISRQALLYQIKKLDLADV